MRFAWNATQPSGATRMNAETIQEPISPKIDRVSSAWVWPVRAPRAERTGSRPSESGETCCPPLSMAGLGLRVLGVAAEVDADARLVADRPGVVTRRDRDHVTGADLLLCAVFRGDVHPAGDDVHQVG